MNYKKSFKSLSLSALVAQLISFLAIPFIARIYSPSSFAEFSFWSSIGGMLGGIILLKQENYILSRNRAEWPLLLNRIRLIYIFVSICFMLFLVGALTTNGSMSLAMYLLAFSYSVSTSLILLVSNLSSILGGFNLLGKARVVMSLLTGPAQLLIGFVSDSAESLLIGAVIGQLAYVLIINAQVREVVRVPFKGGAISSIEIKQSISSIFSGLIQSLATSGPVVTLYVSGYVLESGAVALIQRIALVPMTFIAKPLSSVFIHYYKASKPKSNINIIILCFCSLAILSYVVMVLFAEVLGRVGAFSLFFGNSWVWLDEYGGLFVGIYLLLIYKSLVNVYYVLNDFHVSLFVMDLAFISLSAAAFLAINTGVFNLLEYAVMLNIAYAFYILTPTLYALKK